jgi:hypothetical protein
MQDDDGFYSPLPSAESLRREARALRGLVERHGNPARPAERHARLLERAANIESWLARQGAP